MGIQIFIDESGGVKRGVCSGLDYYVISLVITPDAPLVEKIFKNERLKVIKRHPELVLELKSNGEVKGSHLSENQKSVIYKRLVEKCAHVLTLGNIVLCNHDVTPNFRENTPRVFNYLLRLFLENYCFKPNLHAIRQYGVEILIDEQNVATKSLHTCEDYLNTTLALEGGLAKNNSISVGYADSSTSIGLQLADFVANTGFRYIHKKNDIARNNTAILWPCMCEPKIFWFPLSCKEKDTFKVAI